MKFKKGDRIIITEPYGPAQRGNLGSILESAEDDMDMIGVRFDKDSPGFHDCNGLTENGHGYWVEKGVMEHYDDRSLDYILGLYGS